MLSTLNLWTLWKVVQAQKSESQRMIKSESHKSSKSRTKVELMKRALIVTEKEILFTRRFFSFLVSFFSLPSRNKFLVKKILLIVAGFSFARSGGLSN